MSSETSLRNTLSYVLFICAGLLGSATVWAEGERNLYRPWGTPGSWPESGYQRERPSSKRYNPWQRLGERRDLRNNDEQEEGAPRFSERMRKSLPDERVQGYPEPYGLEGVQGYGGAYPMPPQPYVPYNQGFWPAPYWADPYRPMHPGGGYAPWGGW